MSEKQSSQPGSNPRPIRSFVLRQGRKTKAQQHALDNYWSAFGIEKGNTLLDFAELFGNEQPVTLEIGFGNGESLATMAQAAPQRNFIGIEVHSPGVGHLLHLINGYQLSNVRVLAYDATEILKQRIMPESLDRLQLFFPDPWHKKRHHKRRLVQPDFVSLVARRLRKEGVLHMATDWEDYAIHMVDVMTASTDFANCHAGDSPYTPRPDSRPLTKFEQRGLKLGHEVWDLLYYRL